MVNEKPSEEEARKAYDEVEREAAKYRGIKRELILDLPSLTLLFGREAVARFPGLECGIFGVDKHFYAQRRDGSRHPIGKPSLKVLKNEND
jgi:hypothetical protein